MGNVLLDNNTRKKSDPVLGLEAWLQQNPDLTNKRLLTENKVFRTMSFAYNSSVQSILCKVYLQWEPINLEEYRRTIDLYRRILDPSQYHNMLPFMDLRNFDQPKEDFVTVMRQYLPMTVEERLSAQPSLSLEEKNWIVLQMIVCVYALHCEANLYHGHLRTSNFLLQSNDHVVLTDFATYKPLYMLENDLGEFRLYYGSSGQKCSLAPEKLISQAEQAQYNRNPIQLLQGHRKEKNTRDTHLPSYISRMSMRDTVPSMASFSTEPNSARVDFRSEQITIEPQPLELQTRSSEYSNEVAKLKQMDIFSLGCTIMDVLLNGKPMMSFENLLQFKKGQFSLQPLIQSATEGLPNAQLLRELLGGMLDKDPEKRPTAEELLHHWLDLSSRDVSMLVWYLQNAFCKGCFFTPDLRIGLLRRVIQRIEAEEPLSSRVPIVVDLPLSMQRIEFLRIFMTQIEKSIAPNLWRANLLKGTTLERIEQFLTNESQLEAIPPVAQEDPEECSSIVVESVEKHRDDRFWFSSSSNLRTKKFCEYKPTAPRADSRWLCPPKWTPELESLQKAKFRGSKLTEQQSAHNLFQERLEQVKRNQSLREQFQSKTNYAQHGQLLKLIFCNIRRARYTNSRMAAVELLFVVGSGSTDRTKMQRVLPYLFTLTNDADVQVAGLALRRLLELFYTIAEPFGSADDTKYYRAILENFTVLSKSVVLRSLFFEKLPDICGVVEWLAMHCVRFNRGCSQTDQHELVDAVLKQYGVYSANDKEVLIESISQLWSPSVVPFFGSMLNVEKVLGFKEGIRIAEKKHPPQRYEFLDMCLESGLDESGVAVFYAIRYFRLRQLTSEHIVAKIVPLLVYPHRWIREEAVKYVEMCVDAYPASKLYLLFSKLMDPPFPLQPRDKGDASLLPRMLSFREVDLRERQLAEGVPTNKTVELFRKYLAKIKPAREFPQIDEEQLNKWRIASRNLLAEAEQKRPPCIFGDYVLELILDLYRSGLLVYLNFIARSEQPLPLDEKAHPPELIDLCEKTYGFSLKGSTVCHEQKLMLNHVQSYLNANSESFMRTHKLTSARKKLLFAENLLRVNSLMLRYDSHAILPTLSLGKSYRDPMELSRSYKPTGMLIAEITEHKDTISCIEKVGDRFFATGSYDGTVRFFDSKRLQEDITSDSFGAMDMREGAEGGLVRITTMAAIEQTQSIVVGTSKGTVSIFRLEVLSKDSRIGLNRLTSKLNNSGAAICVERYQVRGEVEKLITFRNDANRSCFAFTTAEGYIGMQDIRVRNECLRCSLGKERGLPKSMLAINGNSSVVVGTVNGYMLTYDVRCNLLSAVHQLFIENQPLPVMSLHAVPIDSFDTDELVAVCYPAKNYEFCYFNMNDPSSEEVPPVQLFTSGSPEEIVVSPYLVNRTKQESFMNCAGSLAERGYYKFLPSFYDRIDVLEYLKDPLNQKANVTKQRWLSSSKQRYSQITSISNKRFLPFLEFLSCGILTQFNPSLNAKGKPLKPAQNLSLLNAYPSQNKRESKIVSPIEKDLRRVSNNWFLPEQESPDYFTCCKVLSNLAVVGGRDSVVRIYR